MNITFLSIVIAFMAFNLSAQSQFSEDPYGINFITADYDTFWKIFDEMDKQEGNPFIAYLENVTEGLRPLVQYVDIDQFYEVVLAYRDSYIESRGVLADVDTYKKRVSASYAALEYWYPEAVYPPVYFYVGMFTSGGTVTEKGLLIGSEMLSSLDHLDGLISHELIHFQQNISGINNLLSRSITEGSADFIGELISGQHINQVAFEYGEAHEQELCKEFVSKMMEEDLTDWLYGTSGVDSRPNDLGYWMGYKITEAYFLQEEDKKEAIADILNIKDAFDFTIKSGYLTSYLE